MIPLFKRILFATDLSENSRHAFFFAASLAARYDGEIILLHVMEKAPVNVEHELSTFLGEERWKEMQEAQKKSARGILIGKRTDHEMVRKALNAFCNSASSSTDGCSCNLHDIIIKTGKVVDEIIDTGSKKGCDVIVIGTHKGFFGSTAVGGIAKGVLHQTRVPVLVVPPPETSQAKAHQ